MIEQLLSCIRCIVLVLSYSNIPPLLRAAAAARVGSAAASTLLVAAPPQAAPGRALEYPALRVKGPARRALEDV